VSPISLTRRAAGPADVPALVALVESAYRGEDSRAGWTTEADLLDGQRLDAGMAAEMVGASGAVVLLFQQEVAAADSRPLACVQLEDRGDGVAYFGTFAVDPRRQGGGVGKQVMAAAEDEARARWGATRMRMTVIRQREDLIAYYERRGYALTGEREPFPYGQERFGLPQRDDLEFVVLEKPLD
jgi:ribosomal protein S18 acetylase RimI-like enzyme